MGKLADIGRAENQPVDISVVGGTVEELEAEIDRLHESLKRLERARAFDLKLANRFIDLQQEEIDRLQKRVEWLEENRVGMVELNDTLATQVIEARKDIDSLQAQNENQARTIASPGRDDK